MRISSNVIFSQYVVLLMTIFRKIGPLWDGNTPDCNCSNNTNPPYVKWSGHDAETKKEKKNASDSPSDAKRYRSATGDVNGIHLLMACEVFARRRCHRSYWKSMFNVRGWPSFFSRLTDLKMFNQLYKTHTPSLISLPELLSHDGSAILYNFTSVGHWRVESVRGSMSWVPTTCFCWYALMQYTCCVSSQTWLVFF